MVDLIPAGVMIPEHNTDTDELLDADDNSGRDDEPLPKRGQGGTIRRVQGWCVCTHGGHHGHGIHTYGGRAGVANDRAREGDNPNQTWKKKIRLKIMITLKQF